MIFIYYFYVSKSKPRSSQGMDELTIQSFKSLPSLVSVDLPVFVKEPSKGYELLGGEASLKHSILHNEPVIHLNLHPNSPTRQCLEGHRQSCTDLLVRVRRKKGSKEPGTAEIIGKITEKYAFSERADFQVTHSPTFYGY